MRLLVCGGRNYNDRARVLAELDAIHAATPITVIIEGGASGADNLASSWARVRNTSSWRVPADWTLGRGAGHARNARMLAMCEPRMVVAFPGGAGTADMVRRARNAGVEVREIPAH